LYILRGKWITGSNADADIKGLGDARLILQGLESRRAAKKEIAKLDKALEAVYDIVKKAVS